MLARVCGRYTLKTNPAELVRQLHLEADDEPALEPRYNLAPLQAAPIITAGAPRRLTIARWGLLPGWARDPRVASRLINARAETLAQKVVFKTQLARHRCLVPCDGFYEWTRHGRQHTPHYLHPREPQVLTMAGLYSLWSSPDHLELVTFTIITTSANAAVRPLHDRMPVFLDEEARTRWLAGPTEDFASLTELLVPWRGALTSYQVGPQVNQVAIDDPSCLEPARTVQLSLL
jgi:putative SOS response-associated peptidase YedK